MAGEQLVAVVEAVQMEKVAVTESVQSEEAVVEIACDAHPADAAAVKGNRNDDDKPVDVPTPNVQVSDGPIVDDKSAEIEEESPAATVIVEENKCSSAFLEVKSVMHRRKFRE
jgi:hypothetical protein